MPYCDDCAKYWTPSSVNADGTCRTCGKHLDGPHLCPACGADQDDPTVGESLESGFEPGHESGPAEVHGTPARPAADAAAVVDTARCWNCHEPLPDADQQLDAEEIDDKVPWHFKLMIVALVVYLGWRFVELGIDIFS